MLRVLIALLVVGGTFVSMRAPSAGAQTPADTLLPSASDLARLLSIGQIDREAIDALDWDAGALYVITPASERVMDLYVFARVLPTAEAAAALFAETQQTLLANNEKTNVSPSDTERVRLRADELLDARLIYPGDGPRERVSNYVRLARVGRVVTMVEALGDPQADEDGAVDNDRALALTSVSELVIGRAHSQLPAAQHLSPGTEAAHATSVQYDPGLAD